LNIVLFEPAEVNQPLPLSDRRAEHILTVLKRVAGDRFDAGVINGPRGKGQVVAITAGALHWVFELGGAGSPNPLDVPQGLPARPEVALHLPPIELWIGLPRPQTARKILQEATALGVSALRFFVSSKAEAGYAQSTLWTSGEWRRHALAGLEQSFTTQLPEIEFNVDLIATLRAHPHPTLLVLDNYEASQRLAALETPLHPPVAIAVGSERGWSGPERDKLRAGGAQLVHLGSRVLRTETACLAALTLVQASLGVI
jgi:16S rRNA (uracil1498-N3)-methyltransferase